MSDPEPDDELTVSEDIEEAREEAIKGMERSAEIYGLNRSYGRLYGLLFFADGPVSLDELVQESGYAKSTVSTAMKELQRLHMVHRRSIPGEGKKAFYEAERDFWTVLQEFLRREVQREIDTMNRALASAEAKLHSVDSDQAEADLEKIQDLQQMYQRSQRTVNVLTSTSIERLAGLFNRLQSS